MSKINKILLVVLVIVLGLIAISASSKKTRVDQKLLSAKTTENKQNNITSQISEGGNVSIEVTPKVLEIGKTPEFELAFNTHSEDLSFDVSKVTKLIDDKNISYQNPLWKGSPPGGHHRSGVLSFPLPLSKTKYVYLVIENVAGVKEKKLRWNL